MNDITLVPLLIGSIPVVLGVVSALKTIGLPSKWSPLVSIGLSLVLAFFVGGLTLFDVILQGLIVGLSASGLYSGTKTTIK